MVLEESLIVGSRDDILKYFDDIVAKTELERSFLCCKHSIENVSEKFIKIAEERGEVFRDNIKFYTKHDRPIEYQIDMFTTNPDSIDESILGVVNLLKFGYNSRNEITVFLESINVKIKKD